MSRNISLDLVRLLAALLVVLGHLRAAVFVDFADSYDQGLLVKCFYFLTSFGHEAVIVFFVLSGYFVGGSVIVKWNVFDFKKYFIARIVRLEVVLIPSLLFSFIIGVYINSLNIGLLDGGYIDMLNSGPINDSGESQSILTLFLNSIFLQGFISPVYALNGPLWSLAYEFWFYMLFPLMFFVYKKNIFAFITLSILLVFLFLFIGKGDFILGFCFWLIGVLFFLLTRKKNEFNTSLTVLLFLLFIISCVLKKVFVGGHFGDFFIAMTFGFFILSTHDINYSKKVRAVICFLSDSSYSLYLFHFPIVLLFFSLDGLYDLQKQLSIDSFIYYVFLLTIIYLVSFLFYFIFEKNTFHFKKLLLRWT
ncbi:acyltransferase [Pseudoalteromonas sp. TAB23]|uniref:acyltransferase family protein n=1 Tax=Pseudoalteromonas sp. TAB23 TaxID=1938595 RepID=UPI0004210C17|nr:acyltransferase [Pseudoalteromonas sp. TAB23]